MPKVEVADGQMEPGSGVWPSDSLCSTLTHQTMSKERHGWVGLKAPSINSTLSLRLLLMLNNHSTNFLLNHILRVPRGNLQLRILAAIICCFVTDVTVIIAGTRAQALIPNMYHRLPQR